MQLVAEIFLPSPVSARDVSDYSSPSCNTPLFQDKPINNDFVAQPVLTKMSVSIDKVLNAMNGFQDAASTQERDLIEQSLVRWCNTSFIKFLVKRWGAQEMPPASSDGARKNSISRWRNFVLSTRPCFRQVAPQSWINVLRPYRVAVC